MERETFTLQIVQLADTEWSSNQNGKKMQNVAREVLQGENAPDICEVWEHGGWSLGYAMIGGEMVCISSANDRAEFSDEVKAFRERVYHGRLEYRPVIKRREFEPSDFVVNLRYWIEESRTNVKAQQVNYPGRCAANTEYWSMFYQKRLEMLLTEIGLK